MADLTKNPTGTDIKKHVQDALDERESKNAYGVSLIPYHTHNGTDSPLIDDNANGLTIDQLLPSQTGNSGKVLTTNGTVSSWASTVPLVQPTVSLLVVAGGGAGTQGGGGGGGVLSPSAYSVAIGSYTVIIGNGGSGTVGQDTIFDILTAKGGGLGGSGDNGVGGLGGNGGGGSYKFSAGTTTGGTGSQGFNGGTNGGYVGGDEPAGGGGGAGAIGGSATSATVAGNGGVGYQSSISGAATYYAGGGGGSFGSAGGTAGTGGNGGGGNGSVNAGGSSGTVNTGGGGGGGVLGHAGGSGGSGIVIISYPTGTLTATGGVITTNGGNTIHTFIVSGTWYRTA